MMEVLHVPRRYVGWIEDNMQWSGHVELWVTAEVTDRDAIKFHAKAVRDGVSAYNASWGAYADTIKIPADTGTKQVIKEAYDFKNGTVEYDFYVSTTEIGKTAELGISLVSGVFTITAEMFIGASSVSASDGYFGRTLQISISALAAEARHTLTVSCAGITKTLLSQSAEITATWTPSVAEYAPEITTAKSAEAVITCTTYIGEANVGSKSSTVTMSFKAEDVMPGITMEVIDPTGLKNEYGRYIIGQSKYTVTLTPALQYGATVESVTIRANGQTYTTNPATTGPVSGETVTAKITDSRGFISDVLLATHELYSYQAPSASIIEVYHCEQNGTRAESGQYLAVRAAATITSLGGQNSLILSAKVKAVNSSGSFLNAGTLANNTATVIGGTWSPDTSWIVKVTAADELENSAEVSVRIGTRIFAFSVKDGATGAAIGKAAEYDNVFELPAGWRIKIGDQYWPE